MKKESKLYELQKVVSQCTGFILYIPTRNEWDFHLKAVEILLQYVSVI